MKHLLRKTMLAWSLFVLPCPLLADNVVTTQPATNVTQTRATLSAQFADGSTNNGFQFKYGILPELNDFDRTALDPASEPVTFITSTGYNWKARANKGWVESYYDSNASNLNSYFYTTVEVYEPGVTVEFEWMVSSEENVGTLELWVAGKKVASISGEKEDFEKFSYTPDLIGAIQFQWVYKRTRAENSGKGLGYVRNIKFTNSLPGIWQTLSAEGTQTSLSGLYPGQGYVWRAFSVKSDAPTDTIFSAISQFATERVTRSDPVVTPTQSKAKVSYAAVVGDAEVETGIVLNPIELTPFQKAALTSDSDPITFLNMNRWGYSSTKVSYNNSSYDYPLTTTFTLTEEADISFDWSVSGYYSSSYPGRTARAYFYVDGVMQKTINVKSSNSTTQESVTHHLSAGQHTIKWSGMAYSGYSVKLFLWNIRITNVDFDRPKTIVATINGDSVNHVISNLKPGRDYRYYTYMRPAFESSLEKRWTIEDTPLQTFTTVPISCEPIVALDNTQTGFTARGVMHVGDANIVARGLQYRVSSGTTWSTPSNVSVNGDTLSVKIKNLRPSTAYAYRSFVQAEGCDTIFSTALTVYTKAVKPLTPVVVSVTQHTATIRGEIDAGEADIYTCGIQFRKNGAAEWEDMEGDEDQTVFTLTKTGLDMSSGYQARTYVQPYGSNIVYSDILYFWTKNIEVRIDSLKPSFRSVTVYGHVSPGDDNVTKASYWAYVDKGDERTGDLTLQDTAFVFTIDNLGPGMKFEVGVRAENKDGAQTSSSTTAYTLSYLSGRSYRHISPTAMEIYVYLNENAELGKEYIINFTGEDYSKKVAAKINKEEYTDSVNNVHYRYYLLETFEGLRPDRSYSYNVTIKFEDAIFTEYGSWIKTLPVSVIKKSFKITQTTFSSSFDFSIPEVTNVRYSLTGNEDDAVAYNDSISLSGLTPSTHYGLTIFYEVNGGKYVYDMSFTTYSVSISFADRDYYTKYQSIAQQTSVLVGLNPNYGTATLVEMGVLVNDERRVAFDSLRCYVNELLPGQQYKLCPYMETKEGGLLLGGQTCYVTTKSMALATLKPSMISNRSATLNGVIECDDLSSAEFGFQWKEKTGWTTEPRFTKGHKMQGSDSISVALVNGMLKPDTEYEYRTAVRYQGQIFVAEEWKDLRTELEYVYYPATAYTLYRTDSENNRLVLCGYYIAGSESVESQGYEYWATSSASRTTRAANSAVQTILTDSTMTASIDLETLADGNYNVRAFVKTASGTIYGQTLAFKVGKVPTDIQEDELTEPISPSVQTRRGCITIINAEGHHALLTDLSGRMVWSGRCGAPQEIHVAKGVYVVRLDNGSTFKLQVK